MSLYVLCINRTSSPNTEVPGIETEEIHGGIYRGDTFQGVGIEGFHCIQRCPHFRVLE